MCGNWSTAWVNFFASSSSCCQFSPYTLSIYLTTDLYKTPRLRKKMSVGRIKILTVIDNSEDAHSRTWYHGTGDSTLCQYWLFNLDILSALISPNVKLVGFNLRAREASPHQHMHRLRNSNDKFFETTLIDINNKLHTPISCYLSSWSSSVSGYDELLNE